MRLFLVALFIVFTYSLGFSYSALSDMEMKGVLGGGGGVNNKLCQGNDSGCGDDVTYKCEKIFLDTVPPTYIGCGDHKVFVPFIGYIAINMAKEEKKSHKICITQWGYDCKTVQVICRLHYDCQRIYTTDENGNVIETCGYVPKPDSSQREDGC